MHEATFRKTALQAGLNPYMVEIANIREQCSWIHKDIKEGTEKAIILGRAAIAKVHLNAPLTAGESPVVKRALVIGGGIAGIQTALDIADAGFEVDIVEKNPTIGGKMAQIDKTFPTLDCAACILTPKMVDCAQNEKIKIYAYSEVDAVSGFVGNFSVKIKRKARYVDETKCTGCGLCVAVCPMGSIKEDAPGIVNGICIKCCGCEKKCPEGALYFDDPGYLYHKEELELGYADRKEPELFL
jgi:heterodisulfide reductase subunit A